MRYLVIGALASAALLAPGSAQAQNTEVLDAACVKLERPKDIKKFIWKQYHKKHDMTPARRWRVRHKISCTLVPELEYKLWDYKKRQKMWRWRRENRWQYRFNGLSKWDRTWAKRIGNCESGNDPTTNTGNGFYGSHQWVLSTWHMAGGSGNPIHASWYEQAVRAVWWRGKTSTMQWPACSIMLGYA